MHESRLINDILSTIGAVAQRNGAVRIETVRIEIGALSHVTPEGFASHFSLASGGTVAEGATLDITKSEDPSAPDALDVRVVSIVAGGG